MSSFLESGLLAFPTHQACRNFLERALADYDIDEDVEVRERTFSQTVETIHDEQVEEVPVRGFELWGGRRDTERLGFVRLTEAEGGRVEPYLDGHKPGQKQFPGPWCEVEGAGRMFDPACHTALANIYLLVVSVAKKIYHQRHQEEFEAFQEEQERRAEAFREERTRLLEEQKGGKLYDRTTGEPAYLVEANRPSSTVRVLVNQEIFAWLTRSTEAERPDSDPRSWEETDLPKAIEELWKKYHHPDVEGIPVYRHEVRHQRVWELVRMARQEHETFESSSQLHQHLQKMDINLVDELSMILED